VLFDLLNIITMSGFFTQGNSSELRGEHNYMLTDSEINPSEYDENTFVAIQRTDWFLSLQIRASNEGMKVICIHEAAQAEK